MKLSEEILGSGVGLSPLGPYAVIFVVIWSCGSIRVAIIVVTCEVIWSFITVGSADEHLPVRVPRLDQRVQVAGPGGRCGV